MAYTYTLLLTYMGSGYNSLFRDNWALSNLYSETDLYVSVNSYGRNCYLVNILFDLDVLASLRAKTENPNFAISAISLNLNIKAGNYLPAADRIAVAYKYNNIASTTTDANAWARCATGLEDAVDGLGAEAPSVGTIAFIRSPTSSSYYTQTDEDYLINFSELVIPKHGICIGPHVNSNELYIHFNPTATLSITTNESSYSYTLAYNANGGSGAPSSLTGSNILVSPSYTFTISSTVPTRSGYEFLGWSTSSSATTASYQPGSTITVSANGTTTLYAVWKLSNILHIVNGSSLDIYTVNIVSSGSLVPYRVMVVNNGSLDPYA